MAWLLGLAPYIQSHPLDVYPNIKYSQLPGSRKWQPLDPLLNQAHVW